MAKKPKNETLAQNETLAKTAWSNCKKTSAEALKHWKELGEALKAIRSEFPSNKDFGTWREKALPDMSNQAVSYAMQFATMLQEHDGFKKAYDNGDFAGIGMPKNAIAKWRFGQKAPGARTPKAPKTEDEKPGAVLTLETALTELSKIMPIISAAIAKGDDMAKSRAMIFVESVNQALKVANVAAGKKVANG